MYPVFKIQINVLAATVDSLIYLEKRQVIIPSEIEDYIGLLQDSVRSDILTRFNRDM